MYNAPIPLGANILLGADSTGTSDMSTGVGIDGGSLTIKGEGSLYAYGGDAANSYGIRVSGGVSIIGGSIKAVSGAGTVAQQALYTDIDVDFGQDKWYQWKTDESSDWTIALNDEYSYTNNGNSTYLEIEKANACKVDFDANGGSNIAETVYVSIGSEYKIPPCMFTPPRDYTFAGWSLSKGGSVITTEGITVNSDTILYAVWNRMGGATVSGGGGGGDHAKRYTVKFETYGGTEIEYQRVARYGYVTKPDAPEKVGYSFDGWYADEKFEKLYDFNSEVSSGFTLYAKWKEITYADVNADAWYYESVKYAVSKGLLDGAGNNEFAPDSKATRAMLITALYRMEGEPATNRSIPFADVDMTAYYANAVIWAKQNGIINGVTETEFAPDAYITREQFVTVIYRYAIYKGMNAVTMEENLYFEDVAEISEYAVPAMNWAVGTELIKGKSETMLNPRDSVTKAETAAILYRFIKMK